MFLRWSTPKELVLVSNVNWEQVASNAGKNVSLFGRNKLIVIELLELAVYAYCSLGVGSHMSMKGRMV